MTGFVLRVTNVSVPHVKLLFEYRSLEIYCHIG